METTTRHGAIAGKTQTTETNVHNLDAILSVGYRVNSKNATAFRIWANQVLRQYLLQGYAINERVAAQKYDELSQLVKVLGRTIQNQERLTEDSRSLLDVVVDYTYALDTLDRYDYQELKIEDTACKAKRIADNTLVALTLMIAESRTEEKDTMVKVIVNLINKNN